MRYLTLTEVLELYIVPSSIWEILSGQTKLYYTTVRSPLISKSAIALDV